MAAVSSADRSSRVVKEEAAARQVLHLSLFHLMCQSNPFPRNSPTATNLSDQ